jgi:acetylornithine/succinyldiaminopimelate/putrescine aminotransferase
LRKRLSEVPGIVQVRGRGFLLGLEFAEKAAPVHQALLNRKIITGTSSDLKVLRLLPPLCLQRQQVDLFIDTLLNITSAG